MEFPTHTNISNFRSASESSKYPRHREGTACSTLPTTRRTHVRAQVALRSFRLGICPSQYLRCSQNHWSTGSEPESATMGRKATENVRGRNFRDTRTWRIARVASGRKDIRDTNNQPRSLPEGICVAVLDECLHCALRKVPRTRRSKQRGS